MNLQHICLFIVLCSARNKLRMWCGTYHSCMHDNMQVLCGNSHKTVTTTGSRHVAHLLAESMPILSQILVYFVDWGSLMGCFILSQLMHPNLIG